jgi:hypothetical protein
MDRNSTKMGKKKNKGKNKGKTVPLSDFLRTTHSASMNAWAKPPNITPDTPASDTPAPKPAPKPAAEPAPPPEVTMADVFRHYWSMSQVTTSDLKAFAEDAGRDEEWILNLMKENPYLKRSPKYVVARHIVDCACDGKLANCVHSCKMNVDGALKMALLSQHSG